MQIPRILRYIYINNHIFDNSIQINIKFTITVYQYILLLSQHIHTLVTLQSFPDGFTWSLSPVETPYPIENMIQVVNKEARAT